MIKTKTYYEDNGDDLCVYCREEYGSAQTPEFWGKVWRENNPKPFRLLKKITRKFVKHGGRVLDGGCGVGQNVKRLEELGYNAYGIDFCEDAIRVAKEKYPGLNAYYGSVELTNFQDNFFDAYWSLGVIEHIQFGNKSRRILLEMIRIIKPGGYLFISFPVRSLLRVIKVKLNLYSKTIDAKKEEQFYQYILEKNHIIDNLTYVGFYGNEMAKFKYIRCYNYDAYKGLKEETGFKTDSKIIKGLINILLSWFCPHIVVLVFKKK